MTSVRGTCNYPEVNVDGEIRVNETNLIDEQTKLPWRNLIRQISVCSTIWTLYFIHGLQLGTPTVLIPQLRRETNSTAHIDDELASWITSMIPTGAWPWTFILPIILHKIGRKKIFMFITIKVFIGSVVIYFSRNITQLLIGEFIVGILAGAMNTIGPLVITEYSSPKYRGLFLTMKTASIFWGMWVANITGTFWHWKNIYMLVVLCHVYTLMVFAWPESPYWLAKEKRFIACVKIHRKLKGTSRKAEQDLDHIINYYKLNRDTKVQDNPQIKSNSVRSCLISWFETFTCPAFYKPIILVIFLGSLYHSMGKMVCSMYAVQILKKVTGNEGAAYKGMIILDGVTVFGAYCGCATSRYFKRRTMLFSTSILSIIILYTFALYLFLTQSNVISENNFISISLLAVFSVSVCSGPMILVSSIYGELISIRYQRPSAIIYGVVVTTMLMVSLKISLFLFKTLTLPGAFLFFALLSSFITLILYLYLPETKDKTVQEIEMYFSTNKPTYSNETTHLQSDS